MTKRIIYTMTTLVPGLIKIGKTGLNNFEQRMYFLERKGYFNVAGLKGRFVKKVDDYDEKETLIDTIFDRSRVPNSELFALDINFVIQFLPSFDGTQIYPKNETKENSFDKATASRKVKEDLETIPNGNYFLRMRSCGIKVQASMRVFNGQFILGAGSDCLPAKKGVTIPQIVKSARISNNKLEEDLVCTSPSTAPEIVMGRHVDGWNVWKTIDGKPIDEFCHHE